MNAPPFEYARGPVAQVSRWKDRVISGRGRTIAIVGAILAGFAAVWLWAGLGTKAPNVREAFRGGAVPVGVAQAVRADMPVTVAALGTVTPLATVTVKPQASGVLEKLNFQEGQMVKAGDVLAVIDPRPYQAAYNQAKGQLARDLAQLSNAKIDLGRYQALASQNAIAQQTLATQSALVRTDEGTVAADRAAVDAAAVNLSYCTITSPVAGRVGMRQIDVGNLVQSGATAAIVVVTQLQPISVVFTLPEDDLNAVMQRMGTGAKLSVDAFDRAQTTKLASGTLSTVDNEIDPTTGTVKLRAIFDNAAGRLFPQQFVNVKLLVNTLAGQTVIPSAAVQRGAQGAYVYVVGRDRTVSVRTVTPGPADNERIDILHGLAPGDVVVVDGADRLKDGAKVTIPNGKPPGFARGAGTHKGRHGAAQGGDDAGGTP